MQDNGKSETIRSLLAGGESDKVAPGSSGGHRTQGGLI